ncbi:hypothetical protein SETIT_8G230200v2 [Setaria italica]|uniref:Uncharacterized protein n=1 Tax=Setaria italica TaxID=4555 RepID=A0A368SAQ1_SETIT|nr:hypothetical protein SETIT_8G230200v2 [Setaria italica]
MVVNNASWLCRPMLEGLRCTFTTTESKYYTATQKIRQPADLWAQAGVNGGSSNTSGFVVNGGRSNTSDTDKPHLASTSIVRMTCSMNELCLTRVLIKGFKEIR